MDKKPGHSYPVKSGNEEDIKKLMDDLRNNKDPEIRRKAAETISWSQCPNPSLFPEINAIYNKEMNPVVRYRIVMTLYYLDEKKSRSIIKQIFEDEEEDRSIRIFAAKVLMKKGNKNAEQFLIDSLKIIPDMAYDPSQMIIGCLGYAKCRQAVGPLGNLVYRLLEKESIEDSEGLWCMLLNIADAFKEIGDPMAVAPLLAILNVKHDARMRSSQRCTECKQHVMRCLGMLKALEAIDPLLELIETPSFENFLKRDALDALSAINNRKALERLYRLVPIYRNNDEMVERLWRVIFEIEEYSEQVCYWCGKVPEIRDIEMESRPKYRKICLACWTKLEPLQNNPDTRTVSYCGWEPDR